MAETRDSKALTAIEHDDPRTPRLPELTASTEREALPVETANRLIDRARPRVSGKFIFIGSEKFYIRGVTYGTFRADEGGQEFIPRVAAADLAAMARTGINTIRTYTLPPRWF